MSWFFLRRSLEQQGQTVLDDQWVRAEYERVARENAAHVIEEARYEMRRLVDGWRVYLIEQCFTFVREDGPISCRVEQIDDEANITCAVQSLLAPASQFVSMMKAGQP